MLYPSMKTQYCGFGSEDNTESVTSSGEPKLLLLTTHPLWPDLHP